MNSVATTVLSVALFRSSLTITNIFFNLLFLIYVNDLPLSLTSTCADIFADDTTIGTSIHSIDTLVETLPTDLQNVLSWCNSNNMSLNVSKPKLSHLDTNSRFLQIAIMIKVYVIVKYKLALLKKLLGVTITNTLCWDAHIDQLIKKCNSYLFLLSRIKVFVSRRNRILFYNSYILPYLDFCCIIWGNCS